MRIAPMRVYADTSVFGGVFDDEFARPTRRFFERVADGSIELVCSAEVETEILDGPPDVRAHYDEMIVLAELVPVSNEARTLQAEYLRQGVVTGKWATDALHVAVATVTRCAAIVSWNFRHIVNYRRIPLYNEVNKRSGYGEIAIYSPLEMTEDEEEEV